MSFFVELEQEKDGRRIAELLIFLAPLLMANRSKSFGQS